MSVPPSPGHPHGYERIDQRNESFCSTVDVVLVESLAARHNGDKFCRISPAATNGYGFMCYRVTFPDDGKEWVVRIAMPTVLGNEWDIVRNEAATLKHLKRNTSIPVPTVHAYGTNERLTSDPLTTQSWIITDKLPGKPVSADDLILMTREKRARLFSQFGDVLAQLQDLTFPTTGSLYPDDSADEKEKIGPSLCRFDQILGLRDGVARSRPTFTTAWDCIEHHLEAMKGLPAMRTIHRGNDAKDDIARQIFATAAVSRHVRDESHSLWAEDTVFSLSHGSLTSDRVFVDDQGNIQGIVNWSLAELLPRQLCQPPNWILNAGASPGHRQYNPVWEEFQAAIPPEHAYHAHLRYYLDSEAQLGFAAILRCPSYLLGVFFWDKVYDALHRQPPHKALAEFYSAPANQAELDRRLADQKQHSDDVIVRQACSMEPKLQDIRDWFMKVQDLVVIAAKAGPYIHDDLPGSPVLSVDSDS